MECPDVEGVLQPHDSEPNWTVSLVGTLGSFGGIVIDVDDVIESPDGGTHRFLELLVVDVAILVQVLIENDAA